jgi:hypothetical protein
VSGCVILRVLFVNGTEREYPVHAGGGDWHYSDTGDEPPRLIVRPRGGTKQNDGRAQCRHEVPLMNVLSVMVVPRGAEADQ